jgi:hypothetical protein
MKALINELRLAIAEKLLSWAFDVAPRNKQGDDLRKFLIGYMLKDIMK